MPEPSTKSGTQHRCLESSNATNDRSNALEYTPGMIQHVKPNGSYSGSMLANCPVLAQMVGKPVPVHLLSVSTLMFTSRLDHADRK